MKLLLSLLALVYTVCPYDLLPDFLLGLGWVDDLIVLGLLWWFLYTYRRRKAGQEHYQSTGGQRDKGEGAGAGHDFMAGDEAPRTPYSVLGVPRGASKEEIKEAYRRLVNQYHPDKVQHLGPEFRELAESRFKEIQEAYQELHAR